MWSGPVFRDYTAGGRVELVPRQASLARHAVHHVAREGGFWAIDCDMSRATTRERAELLMRTAMRGDLLKAKQLQ